MPISEQVIGIRGWKGVHLHDVCTRTRFSSSAAGRLPIPVAGIGHVLYSNWNRVSPPDTEGAAAGADKNGGKKDG